MDSERTPSSASWNDHLYIMARSILPLRNPVDLHDVLRAQRPVDRLDVLLDLFDAGGAGDDA
jgi:hypothetical protein